MSHDDQRLSSHFDNELDEVTAAMVERQLASNDESRGRYEGYRFLRKQLDTDVVGEAEARDTVFRRLERHIPRGTSLWERYVRIPVPALAAAALVLVALGVFTVLGFLTPGGEEEFAQVESPEVDLTISVDSLGVQEMLDWLNRRDMLDEVTIELPQSPTFRLRGEPALLRAADMERATDGPNGNG